MEPIVSVVIVEHNKLHTLYTMTGVSRSVCYDCCKKHIAPNHWKPLMKQAKSIFRRDKNTLQHSPPKPCKPLGETSFLTIVKMLIRPVVEGLAAQDGLETMKTIGKPMFSWPGHMFPSYLRWCAIQIYTVSRTPLQTIGKSTFWDVLAN